MRRIRNPEVLVQILLLFLTAALLIYALASGLILYYVHPRMIPLLWFAAAALVLIGLCLSPGLTRPRRRPYFLPYLLLLFPLLTACLFPPTTVSGSDLSLNGVTLDSEEAEEEAAAAAQSAAVDQAAGLDSAASSASLSASDTARTFTKTYDENGVLQISDSDFMLWNADVYDHPDSYLGTSVKFRAQVFRLDSFADNEFVPARMSMWCCAADVMPVGFLCRWDEASTLADDEWIWITATFTLGEYGGETVPILVPTEITKAEAPADPYVY